MPAPSAPTGFTAVATTAGNLQQWDAQVGLDGFILFRGLASDHSDAVQYPTVGAYVTNGAGTSYLDTEAVAGVHYYYQLVASSLADGDSSRVNADATAVPHSAMSLTEARLWVRGTARNAGAPAPTGLYDETDVDRAIYSACEQFCRTTRYVRTASSVSLTAASAVADFSGVATFTPDRLLGAYVQTVACALEVVDWDELRRLQVDCLSTGDPRILAWESPTLANVYPTPTDHMTLRAQWYKPFTVWTMGTATPGAITFNLPFDVMSQILPVGPPYLLQKKEPEHGYALQSLPAWMDIINRYRGEGNLGAKVIIRESLRERERWGRRRW